MNTHSFPCSPVRAVERTARPAGGPIDFDLFRRKSWSGVSAECVRIAGPADYDFRLDVTSNFLMLLDLQRTDGETAISGTSRTSRKNLRHRLTFAPVRTEVVGWSAIAKPASFTAVYFDPRMLDEERCDLSQCPPMVEFEDSMLRTAMLRFDTILGDPTLDQPGYPETLALLLAFELGRLKDQIKMPRPSQGGLPQWQVKVVIDYLESRLADQTTIAELAELLQLSRFHFIRAFKKTVGMPPHQFILHRRIERARELLVNRELSVGEIAERTGFNGTAQLTRAFRQIAGTTPTAFRREI